MNNNLRNTGVCYPTEDTYFIGWNDDRTELITYGTITPKQCMETKLNEVDFYTNEAEYFGVLIENGINPFPEL